MTTPRRLRRLAAAAALAGAGLFASCGLAASGGSADAGAPAEVGADPLATGFRRPLTAAAPGGPTVRVFADQFDPHLTDAQVRFVASRYAGSQKLGARLSSRLRALAPGFVVLQYRLATGLSTVPNLTGPDVWTTDTPEPGAPAQGGVPPAEEAFYLHAPGPNGARIAHADAYFLADVRNEAWQAWHIAEIRRRMPLNDFDGVFLDTAHLRTDGFTPRDWYAGFCDPDVKRLATCWTPPATAYFTRLRDALHAGPTGTWTYAIGNFGPLDTVWDHNDYLAPLDGGMVELFLWRRGPVPEADWHIAAERILRLCGEHRVLIAQPTDFPLGDAAARRYLMGSLLVLQGRRAFASFYPEGTESTAAPVWLPEYELALGRPIQALPGAPQGLCTSGPDTRGCAGVMRRAYERGLVLVNPARAPRTYTLPPPPAGERYVALSFTGGGYVDAAGRPAPGAIERTPVGAGELTIGPTDAALLTFEPAPIQP